MRRGAGVTRRQLLRAATATVIASSPLLSACGPVTAASPTPVASVSLPPPETTTIRISSVAACDPWAWMVEPYLREEGFTEIRSGADEADLYTDYVHDVATDINSGFPD